MFAGCFLDVWRGSEYASVAVLTKFSLIQLFPICFVLFFFEVLVIETDLNNSSLKFFKIYYINNDISNNKACPHKHQKQCFCKIVFSFIFFKCQWSDINVFFKMAIKKFLFLWL